MQLRMDLTLKEKVVNLGRWDGRAQEPTRSTGGTGPPSPVPPIRKEEKKVLHFYHSILWKLLHDGNLTLS